MLPVAVEVNVGTSGGLTDLLMKFGLLALADDPDTKPSAEKLVTGAINRIRNVNQQMGIPARLGDLGVTAEQIPDIVRSSRGNSMNGNPRDIDDEELAEILLANL
jgi:alcohol dehydrogenase class IV